MVISIDLFLQQYFFKFPVLRYVTCLPGYTLKKKMYLVVTWHFSKATTS